MKKIKIIFLVKGVIYEFFFQRVKILNMVGNTVIPRAKSGLSIEDQIFF